jgi:hypothetical protein
MRFNRAKRGSERLAMLRETVESAEWVQNQLAVKLFVWIAEMYKVEVENEAG